MRGDAPRLQVPRLNHASDHQRHVVSLRRPASELVEVAKNGVTNFCRGGVVERSEQARQAIESVNLAGRVLRFIDAVGVHDEDIASVEGDLARWNVKRQADAERW